MIHDSSDWTLSITPRRLDGGIFSARFWLVCRSDKLIQPSAAVLEGKVMTRERRVWIPVHTCAPGASRFYCPSAFLAATAVKQSIQGTCAEDVYEAEHSPYCCFCFCMCLSKGSPAASPPWVPRSVLQLWSCCVFQCHGNCILLCWLPAGTQPAQLWKEESAPSAKLQ